MVPTFGESRRRVVEANAWMLGALVPDDPHM
jgi:hypothetical protein